MNDNEPAMPIRNPSPADLARYNAWANRNHQPLFGATAAAPAAPAGQIRASRNAVHTAIQGGARAQWNASTRRWELMVGGRVVVLTSGQGLKTTEGNVYSRLARSMGFAEFQLLAWQPGLHMLPGTNAEVAYTVNGIRHIVRRYNAATGRYDATTWGIDYFRDHRAQFTVSIPVYRVVKKEMSNGTVHYVRALHGEGLWLFLTDEEMSHYVNSKVRHFPGRDAAFEAGGIGAANVVPASGTPEAQKAWIRETLAQYMAAMPTRQGHKLLTPSTVVTPATPTTTRGSQPSMRKSHMPIILGRWWCR